MMNIPHIALAFWLASTMPAMAGESTEQGLAPVYEVTPIGWVRKVDGRTAIPGAPILPIKTIT